MTLHRQPRTDARRDRGVPDRGRLLPQPTGRARPVRPSPCGRSGGCGSGRSRRTSAPGCRRWCSAPTPTSSPGRAPSSGLLTFAQLGPLLAAVARSVASSPTPSTGAGSSSPCSSSSRVLAGAGGRRGVPATRRGWRSSARCSPSASATR